jgi:4-hydroxy-tetrahydrodipicolinate synthase
VPVLVGVSHNATYHARELIAHGHKLEVAGFIAAPAVEERRSEERIRRFYATLADAAEGLPVFVQDRPQASGVAFSTELLLRVSEDAANLGFVIVESPPTGRRISRLVRESGGKVRVFGGMAGQFMREELVRGASGCVPGAVFTDALVAIWNMVQQGDHKGAARLDRAFLPLLHHCSQSVDWEVNCTKTLLKKGGLLRSARLRQPAQAFDEVAVEQLMVYAADLDLAILRA